MTVIRPNSISGVTSITALANEINVFKHDGVLAGLQLNGVNHHTSSGVSTFHTVNVLGNLDVAGVLTYQDVTNVDSLGIGTFRTGINVSGGQLDVGSNIKLGNAGVITATSFVGNGSQLTGLNSDLVNDTSPQLGGNLDTNSHEISLDTSHAINFGDSNELKVFYHSGNGQIDFNGNTSLQLKTPANKYFQVVNRDNGNNIIQCQAGGEAGLYHNGNKTAYTHGSGFNLKGGNTSDQTELQIFGNEGQDASILLTSDDGDDNADNWRIYAQASDHSFAVKSYASGGYQSVLKGTSNRSIELHYQGSSKLETVTGGVQVTGAYELEAASGQPNPTIDNADGGQKRSLYFKTGGSARLIIQDDGHTRPASNNTFDLGTTGDRWRNIYTNDLNLSNKGSTNCVDNTWGDYTIQEGESDLFLINNRSGKKYKFNLTELS